MSLDPKAIWTGPPSPDTIRWILNNTHTDDRGRRYYKNTNGSFQRLRSPNDFLALNARLAGQLESERRGHIRASLW